MGGHESCACAAHLECFCAFLIVMDSQGVLANIGPRQKSVLPKLLGLVNFCPPTAFGMANLFVHLSVL